MPLLRRSRVQGRALLKLSALVFVIVAANLAAEAIADLLQFEIRPSNEDIVHRMIMTAAVAYIVLLAIPFVPGVEVGLAMIGMLGPEIVFLVYLCTVLGLALSFTIGRLMPLSGAIQLLTDLGLHKASRLLSAIESTKRQDRLAFLISASPNRYVPFLLRHRYLALALVVNLPGNVIVGGGGGIALAAGASGLYSPLGFLATIVIAVSPVPLAVFVLGRGILPWLF